MKIKTRTTHIIKLSDKDLRALVEFYYKVDGNAWPQTPSGERNRVGEFFYRLGCIVNPPKDENHSI